MAREELSEMYVLGMGGRVVSERCIVQRWNKRAGLKQS